MAINTLHRAIADACAARPFAEKWLIAPSVRVGRQWVTAVAQSGQCLLNVHCRTVRSLAMHLAGPRLEASGRRMLTVREGEMIVDRLWGRCLRPGARYLGRMEPGTELCRVLHRAVSDLRLAGLSPEDMAGGAFEVSEKADEVRELLAAWQEVLAEESRIDYADALREAVAVLQAEGLPPDVCILLPVSETDDYRALERDLLAAIPAEQLIRLPVDEPCAGEPDTDRALLAWLASPTEAPPRVGDGSVEFVHAVGAANEVREALRRCVREGLALDRVEVLYTDADTYAPLLYEAGCELWAGDAPSLPDDVPMTFADGLPVRYTRPGRALAAWLHWWREGYPQGVLVRMFQDGLLNRPAGSDEEITWQELADLLRPLPIGNGRGRYVGAITAALQSVDARREAPELRDEDGEPLPDPDADRRLRALTLLKDMVAGLFRCTPRDASDGAEVLQCALTFVAEGARGADEFDAFGRKRLREEIEEMMGVFVPDAESSLDVARWLATLPTDSRVRGLGPRPGCLHVSDVRTGGHSGRPVTFIIGLDDTRFPGFGSQDPVLLDEERARLDERLPLAASRAEAQVQRFAATLAGLRGRVVLSCSCRELSDDRELFPSPLVLNAFRIVVGPRDADLTALLDHLGTPASFAPARADACLSPAEWWLWRLCTEGGVADPAAAVQAVFPHLASGAAAQRSRLGADFTPYDGHVPEAGAVLDPCAPDGAVMSASGLESVGRCPLQFFFQRVLDLAVPEELELDPDRWLDPLQTGSLLHDVFHDFMVELAERDAMPPDFERDFGLMMELLDASIERWCDRLPPPHPSVFQRERRQLQAACRNFLASESEFCRTSTPRFFEVAVGMRSSIPPTAMDEYDPPAVNLPGGRSLRARGRLDRVDSVGEHEWTIWDYKSGSATKYARLKAKDPFDGGRRVQHALYLALAEHALRRIDPEARVREFGYFMPSERGDAERVAFAPEELAAGRQVIERLACVIAAGAFLPTDECRGTCEYCDFLPICGDVESLTAAAQSKLADSGDEALEPFREVRGYE